MRRKPPTELNLLAIRELWQVHYEKVKQSRVTTKCIAPYELLIKKPSLSVRYMIPTVENWLKRKARRHLVNWLKAISEDAALDFHSASVRGQRARWGSCSETKSISLNYKLMFLPAPLVDYILVHELCHTKHMNHSKHFWQLVEQHEPDYKEKRQELYKSHLYLPRWLE